MSRLLGRGVLCLGTATDGSDHGKTSAEEQNAHHAANRLYTSEAASHKLVSLTVSIV